MEKSPNELLAEAKLLGCKLKDLPNLPEKKVKVPKPLSADMKKLQAHIKKHADFKGKKYESSQLACESRHLKKYKCRMLEGMKEGKSLEECHNENKKFI